MKYRGTATIEACLVMPMVLFFMLAMGELIMMLFAEAHIHQSLGDAAEYCALQSYLLRGTTDTGGQLVEQGMLNYQFHQNLLQDTYVEKLVEHGKNGILITRERDGINSKIFYAKARYLIKIPIPLFGNYERGITDVIKQKAFLGYSKEEQGDTYVYITPNQSVYHLKRSCTYLSVETTTMASGNTGSYHSCGFCGRRENDTGTMYVSRSTNTYHYRRDCSGLKRTIYRVQLREVQGLGVCSRCGR